MQVSPDMMRNKRARTVGVDVKGAHLLDAAPHTHSHHIPHTQLLQHHVSICRKVPNQREHAQALKTQAALPDPHWLTAQPNKGRDPHRRQNNDVDSQTGCAQVQPSNSGYWHHAPGAGLHERNSGYWHIAGARLYERTLRVFDGLAVHGNQHVARHDARHPAPRAQQPCLACRATRIHALYERALRHLERARHLR